MVWVIDNVANELHTFFKRFVLYIPKVKLVVVKHQLLVNLRVERGMYVKLKEPKRGSHTLNFWTLESLDNFAKPILIPGYKLIQSEQFEGCNDAMSLSLRHMDPKVHNIF
ncbi:hypothetical protein D3C86_1797450 [compost metagenome]